MSLFDGYKKETNVVVTGIMGSAAVWVPSDGSVPAGISAKVLFKNPTKGEKLNGVEYNPHIAQIEYHADDIPGLENAVRDGNIEHITIDGVSYLVEKVNAKWDGDINMAELAR